LKKGIVPPLSSLMRFIRVMSPVDSLIIVTPSTVETRSTRNSGDMSIPVVARQLRLTPAQVYGAITFYSEFRTTPPPETLVSWCSGPACLVRGSLNVRAAMEAVLGVGMGESTPDNSVGFHLGQCNGACDLAPLVWLNGRARGPLSVADAVRLARELKEGQGSGVKGQRKLS